MEQSESFLRERNISCVSDWNVEKTTGEGLDFRCLKPTIFHDFRVGEQNTNSGYLSTQSHHSKK